MIESSHASLKDFDKITDKRNEAYRKFEQFVEEDSEAMIKVTLKKADNLA